MSNYDCEIDYITSQDNCSYGSSYITQDEHPLFTSEVKFQEHMSLSSQQQWQMDTCQFDSFEFVQPLQGNQQIEQQFYGQESPQQYEDPNNQINEESSFCSQTIKSTLNNLAEQSAEPQIQTAAPNVPRLSVKEKAIQRKKAIEKRYPSLTIPVIEIEELEELEELDKKKQQKIKNRISAQRSRDLKKLEFGCLRDQVNELTRQVQELVIEKDQLLLQLRSQQCSRCSQNDSSTDNNSDMYASSSGDSFEYVRQRNKKYSSSSSFSLAPLSVLMLIALIAIANFNFLNHSNKQEQVTPIGNHLMLNEVHRNNNYAMNSDSQDDIINSKNQTISEEDAAIFAKLITVNGIDPDMLNYDTRIIDSRATASKGQLAMQEFYYEENRNDGSSFQKNKITIDPSQIKNDQIYCADPMIFLNNLSKEKRNENQQIDLVYMSSNAKSFIQFGDQYYQAKGDVVDTYVQLKCQVLEYNTKEI